jgi:hypothetical protein
MWKTGESGSPTARSKILFKVQRLGKLRRCFLFTGRRSMRLFRNENGVRNNLSLAIESRRRLRLPLRCQVHLYRPGSELPIDGETLNVSADGFYCVVEAAAPLNSGESLDCILTLPTANVPCSFGSMRLKCDVEVVRVDVGTLRFGVACRIHNFSLVRPSETEMKSMAHRGL